MLSLIHYPSEDLDWPKINRHLNMFILGFDVPVTVALLVGVVLLIYIYGKRRNRVLRDAGIPGPDPEIYLGNIRRIFSEGIDFDNKMGKQYGPVFGIWLGGVPFVNVLDTDILREVLVKDFDTFTDRMGLDLDNYPLDLGIFSQKGASWKRLRNIISPTFSGSKLRKMCSGVNDCARKLVENFIQAANNDEVIDIKRYFGGFTMDAIASTAFGIDTGSQNDLDNSFIKETKKVFDNAFLEDPIVFLIILFPEISPILKKIGFSSFPRSTIKFFNKSLKEIIEGRKSEPKEIRERRVDFLQLMLDAEGDKKDQNGDDKTDQSKKDKKMTTDEVMGQAFLFFLAGYETTANTLHFVAYSLAMNLDIQQKLQEEIDSVLDDKEPDYDNIHKLVYMDHVIDETLRMYPVVPALNRYVSKTTTIKGWKFPKGVFVNIPTTTIHRNPDVYPEPKKFRPERWEKKSEIDPMHYLPFGHGPRHCIGLRLAQLEMKIALVHVMRKVTFVPAPDTPDELTEFKVTGAFVPKNAINLKVKLR